MSSSVISSPRSVPPIFADDQTNNSTEVTTQEKQSTESESQASDESSNVAKSEEQSQEKQQPNSNRPPKANAGPNLVVNPGDKVVLNAEKSTDPDEDKLSFMWIQIAPKKPRVDLKDSNSIKTSFISPQLNKATSFTFLLTAKDDSGAEAKDLATVRVNSIQRSQNLKKEQNVQDIPKNIGSEKNAAVIDQGKKSTDKILNNETDNPAKIRLTHNNFQSNANKTRQVQESNINNPDLVKLQKQKVESSSAGLAAIPLAKQSSHFGAFRYDITHGVDGSFAYSAKITGDLEWDGDTFVPHGIWSLDCNFGVPLPFQVNTADPSTGSITFGYKLDFPEVGRIGIFAGGDLNDGIHHCPPESARYFEGEIVFNDGNPFLNGKFVNAPYIKDQEGNIISKDRKETSKSFPGPGDISRSVTTEWDIFLQPKINRPPDIEIDTSPSVIVEPGTKVTLDASKSTDPDPGDSIKRFTWSQIAGPDVNISESDLSKPAITFKAPNVTKETTVSFSVNVEDQNGAISIGGKNIIIKPVNHPPNPVILVLPSNTVSPGTLVTLDGKGSTDPDPGDGIAAYAWKQSLADKISAGLVITDNGRVAQFKAPNNETTLHFTLDVKDNHDIHASKDVAVQIICASSSGLTESKVRSSLDAACGKPKITVEVDSPEINPTASTPSQTTITIKGVDKDGKPINDFTVEVKTCTEPGRSSGDGHLHDKRASACDKGNRPLAILKSELFQGNPITVKLLHGEAKVQYFSPRSPDTSSNYFISGIDHVIATAANDDTVKDDSKTITTKVPGLQPLPGSSDLSVGPCSIPPDQKYRLGPLNLDHGCLFYGTSNTNSMLSKMATKYDMRQKNCAATKDPRTSQACHVDAIANEKKGFVTITGNPLSMIIEGMALPWGGLHDLGPNTKFTGSTFWNPPFKALNDGHAAIIGFGGLANTDLHIRLLKDVIINNGGELPNVDEGGILSKTKDHFYVVLSAEPNDFSVECSDGPRGVPGREALARCSVDSKGTFAGTVELSCSSVNQPSIKCSFEPKNVALKDGALVESILHVDLPKETKLGSYDLFVLGKSDIKAHSISVALECGICIRPAEGISLPTYTSSQAGLLALEKEEGFGGTLKTFCGVDEPTSHNCKIITPLLRDDYGLYNDEPNTKKALEDCNLRHYCVLKPGNCTQGIGDLVHLKPCTTSDLNKYLHDFPGGMTHPQAFHQFTVVKIPPFERALNKALQVQLTQDQYDAMVSFTYNAGATGGPAHLMPTINAGRCDPAGIVHLFLSHTPGINVDRHTREAKKFNSWTTFQ